MRKRKKMLQGLAIALGCAMVFGLGGGYILPANSGQGVTVVAEAADTYRDGNGFTYWISGHTATITDYVNYDNSTVLDIPESIKIGENTYTVTRLRNWGGIKDSTIKEVKIPSTIEYINNVFFDGLTSVERYTVQEDNMTHESGNFEKYYDDDGVLCVKVYREKRRWNQDTRSYEWIPVLKKCKLIRYPAANSASSYTIPSDIRALARNSFKNATNLQNVSFEEGANFVSVPEEAFYGCSQLNSVQLPDKLKRISRYAFYGCSKLQSINFPGTLQKISRYAFSGCSSLQKVEFPDSLLTISNHAFENCSSLTFDKLPDSLTTLSSYAFSGCSSLKSVNIPTYIHEINKGTFAGTGLTELTIPDQVRVISTGAFEGCGNLKKVTLSPKVADIKTAAFRNCGSLEEINLPEGIKNIKPDVFKGCASLKNISIPDSVTHISSRAFEASGLESVDLNKVESIGPCAFELSPNLKEVKVGDSLTTIGKYAFYGCPSLKEIKLPAAVTTIKRHALGYQDYSNQVPGSVNMHKKDFNIIGVKGSAAETYALDNHTTFTDENGNVTKPTEKKTDQTGSQDNPGEKDNTSGQSGSDGKNTSGGQDSQGEKTNPGSQTSSGTDTKALEDQISKLNDQIEELKKTQNSGNTQDTAAGQRENAAQVQMLERQITILQGQITDQQALKNQITDLQKQLDSVKNSGGSAADTQNQDVNELKSEIAALREDLAGQQKKAAEENEKLSIRLVRQDRPENVTVSVKNKILTAKWSKSEANKLKGYRVYYSLKKNTGYQSLGTVRNTKIQVKVPVKKGRKVYIKVRGYKKIHKKTIWTRYSTPIRVTIR